MVDERVQRRLAAILAADVVGYSRLMDQDETATLAVLKSHRRELIDPTFAEYNGRIVKLMGDGALVEFASVVDAVQCAVAIQQGMSERNAQTPESKRIEFRIGINLGDILVDGDDIYGEGVNIASRLETLAEPGGICISESVHTAVGQKLALEYEFLGEQQVKNITKPVRTYRVTLDTADGPGNVKPPDVALKILVADDHALIREALKNVLKELDDRVVIVEASDCPAVLSQADEHQDLDLILLDLHLPGIGGFAVLTELRRRYPAIPVVVLSAHEDRNIVTEGLDRGAMGFIPKSSPNEVMVSALRLVLSGGKYLPPQILATTGPTSTAAETAGAAGFEEGKVVRSAADLGLTERQQQVLALLMHGKSNKHICRELGVAERTVKIHVSAILRALNVTSRTQAVIAVERLGLKFDPPGGSGDTP